LLIVVLLTGNGDVYGFSLWETDESFGKMAQDFTLKDVKGNVISLSSFRGKAVLLNFWASWCPYCRKERAELNHLYREYNARGLVIISISNDRAVSNVREYLKKIPADFTVLSDSDSTVSDSYGVRALPTNILIDRDGRLVNRFTGYRKWTDPASSGVLEELLRR
jgi:peroxiredoxin